MIEVARDAAPIVGIYAVAAAMFVGIMLGLQQAGITILIGG